jgi:putative oxidoreductase
LRHRRPIRGELDAVRSSAIAGLPDCSIFRGGTSTMKIVRLIARLLMGLEFTVFGLNGFLHFIPMTLPEGVAGQFLGAMFVSKYVYAIAVLELVGGVLLLVNRYVPLALTLLGPVLVNILLFHILMEPQGLPIAIITAVLWLLVYWGVRSAFAGIFVQRVPTSSWPSGI